MIKMAQRKIKNKEKTRETCSETVCMVSFLKYLHILFCCDCDFNTLIIETRLCEVQSAKCKVQRKLKCSLPTP
jgi:hypothetical protein